MQLSTNGIVLEVEDHGPQTGEPILLVMGLGMQLLGWHEGFVAQLVERGFRVIRFDNRDIGLSQTFDHLGVPNLGLLTLRHALGLRVRSAYTLADMARDALGVLDALGIASAHVCGASMGGMIAQQMAHAAPERIKSLTLMMTSSGARQLPGAPLKVRSALIARPPSHALEVLVEHYVNLYALIGSPAYPAEPAALRERLAVSIQRSYRPAGTARQMVAIVADGDRSPMLGAITMPTAIIHGEADVLVPVAAGRDLKAKIPSASIDLIPGMGHDLPAALWPRFVADIAQAAGRA